MRQSSLDGEKLNSPCPFHWRAMLREIFDISLPAPPALYHSPCQCGLQEGAVRAASRGTRSCLTSTKRWFGGEHVHLPSCVIPYITRERHFYPSLSRPCCPKFPFTSVQHSFQCYFSWSYPAAVPELTASCRVDPTGSPSRREGGLPFSPKLTAF